MLTFTVCWIEDNGWKVEVSPHVAIQDAYMNNESCVERLMMLSYKIGVAVAQR